MTTKRSLVAVSLAALAVLVTAPCLAEDLFTAIADSAAVPKGYVQLQSTEIGLSASFELNGNRISFETLRGQPVPSAVRRVDPTAPAYEIDIRFLDARGYPFFIQYGGHGLMDESWNPEAAEPKDALERALWMPTDAQARASFRIAARALVELSKTRLQERQAAEQKALLQLLPAFRSLLVIEKTESVALEATTACDYKNRIEVHDKSTFFGALGARHSATLAKNISSAGQTTQVFSSCNHGTCATDMPLKCSWTSAANRCTLPYYVAECGTSYGFVCNTHVCNDDSVLQIDSVKNLYCPSPQSATCTDCSLRVSSPGC